MKAILNEAEQFARANHPDFSGMTVYSSPMGTVTVHKTAAPLTADLNVHHYHHDSSWGWWGWRPHFFSNPYYDAPVYRPAYDAPAPSSRSSKKEEPNPLWVVAAAAVVALAAIYGVGKDLAKIVESNQKIKTLDIQADSANSEVGKVIAIHKKMLEDMKASGETNLMLKAALAASAVAVGAGAALAAPAVVAGGVASAGATGVVMLLCQGYCDADTTMGENASRLLEAVEKARA